MKNIFGIWKTEIRNFGIRKSGMLKFGIWNLDFENLELENLKFESLEFENSEFGNLEFEKSELKIEKWTGFFCAGIWFENFFGTCLCRQSTLVLEVQP